jgi:DinB superfamily
LSPELEFVRRETERAIRGVSNEALLRPPEGKWNSLQVLEHLVHSYTATTKGLLRTMAAGQPEPSNRNLQQRMRSLYVLWIGRFPAGIESPKQTTPRGALGDEPLRKFNDALVAMDATLADVEKRFGARTRILVHPILGPLTAQQWRRFHQVHGRHHLKQITARVSGRA